MTNITRHITDRQNIITSRLSIIVLCFSIITLSFLNITFLTGTILGIPISTVSALSYQSSTDVSFTFDPILSISVSPDSITIPTIAPGTTDTSNTITVNVSTNTAYGYSLLASVGNNTQYNTSDLIHNDSTIDSSFTSISPTASLPSLTDDNTWGYSTSLDSGSTWSTYHGLPLYSAVGNNTSTTSPALLIDTKSPADSKSIDFRIAARASSTQPSGTYSNVINFYAVGKPEQPPADLTFVAGEHIDTLIVADSSRKWKPFYATSKGTSNSISFASPTKNTRYLVTVVPEPGYVLSSDPTKSSYAQKFTSGTLASNTLLTTTYTAGDVGDVITVSAKRAGSDATYPAYATMQALTVAQCPTTSSASPQGINVTDSRDGKSYTVAKFGNQCHMLSNLRLDNTMDDGHGGTTARVLTRQDSDIKERGVNYENPATGQNVTATEYTMPTEAWISTSQNYYCKSIMKHYSQMNGTEYRDEYYYNWYTAKANPYQCENPTDEKNASEGASGLSLGSICPAGWTLPIYNSMWVNTLLGSNDSNPGALATSGFFFSGSQVHVGYSMFIWSSDIYSDSYAYALYFFGTEANRSGVGEHYGNSVRCMLSN